MDFCIPTGMLEREYLVQYPLIPQNNSFLIELEKTVSELANKVYSIFPFDMALVGEEVSGMLYFDSLTKEDVENGGVILPKKTRDCN